MTAALESAKAGYQVYLVEKEPQLGGFANKLYKKIPTRDYRDPVIVDTDIDKVIKEVESHPNIKVYKSAKVEKTDGQPGLYDVTIASSAGTETVKIGAIVLATGWVPYDATKLDHLGYGK
jgi:quinone-modifying oxidoreductase subunit QmoB